MADTSTFPTTLDADPTDRAIGDPVPVTDWNLYLDAVTNLEGMVGVSGSNVTYSHDYLIKTLPPAGSKSRVVQVVNYQTGEVATGTTVIPWDDTIPLSGEGNQYMSLAITPTNASNKLKIDIVFVFSMNANRQVVIALFQDAVENALAAVGYTIQLAGDMAVIPVSYYMVAGTTSATTFKVRAGPNSDSTLTFNGTGAARKFGGVCASSITITEIAV